MTTLTNEWLKTILKDSTDAGLGRSPLHNDEVINIIERLLAAEAQLAELRGQEPVAIMVEHEGHVVYREAQHRNLYDIPEYQITPLYAAPAPPAASQPVLSDVIEKFSEMNIGFPVQKLKADYVISWVLNNYPCDIKSQPYMVPDYFASLVGKARIRADKAMRKFPQPNYVLNKVAEESGEVIKAVIHYTEGREEWSNVEGEIIDNLAMLIRLVIEGDQVIGFTPPEACRAAMLGKKQ